MVFLENMLYQLEYLGVSDVILPFLLIFTLTYIVFKNITHLFNSRQATIMGIIMGLAVVIPHVTGNYPYQADVVNIINGALPYIGLVLVGILMIFLIAGVFGKEFNVANLRFGGIIMIVSMLIVFYIFANSAGWFQDTYYIFSWLTPTVQAWVFVIALAWLFIWLITGESEGDDKDPWYEKLGKGLDWAFKKRE